MQKVMLNCDVHFLFSTRQGLAWWEPLDLEMSAPPGAEGEEGEVVEEAEVSITEAAMAKEVKTDPGFTGTAGRLGQCAWHSVKSLENKIYVLLPGGFGTYGYGNSANSGYSECPFLPC